MAIYVFNLLVGYYPNGVDYAQGYRERMLKNFSDSIKYVFTEVPRREDIRLYRNVGIDVNCMISAHQYITGHCFLGQSTRLTDKLEELKTELYYTEEENCANEILLIRNGSVVAKILLDESNGEYFYGIQFFNHEKLVRTEIYTDCIRYSESYMMEELDNGSRTKLARRSFYNSDGTIAYDQIFYREEERYLFPDGRYYTRSQFIAEFIKKLDLSEKDIVLLDRSAQFEFVQPLFQFGKKARFITVFHSGHFFEKGEDSRWTHINLNWEYLYWFKYSKQIETMVVLTEEQKKELIEKLKEYGCRIPNIAVIPPKGIEYLRFPEKKRQPYSMLTASRIVPGKRIDWIIKSVIAAHRVNPKISLDIFGDGEAAYVCFLKNMVEKERAQSYIRFAGWVDVTEVYKNYEVFVSASIREAMSLSVMEAIGSGTAVIGLDVKYSNRLCIHSEGNGYLIDFDSNYLVNDDSRLIEDMAGKIVEIFSDEERLESFHQYSYMLAERFSSEIIAKSWKELLN